VETRVRSATLADAAVAVEVLRDSITHVCAGDHGNDAATLERWLSNKTVEHFNAWLSAEGRALVVATHDDTICGVGLIHGSGNVRLRYVRSSHQGMEVSGGGERLTSRRVSHGIDVWTNRRSPVIVNP
jgi:hypothetical protein